MLGLRDGVEGSDPGSSGRVQGTGASPLGESVATQDGMRTLDGTGCVADKFHVKPQVS
jgi:hypothetical protein